MFAALKIRAQRCIPYRSTTCVCFCLFYCLRFIDLSKAIPQCMLFFFLILNKNSVLAYEKKYFHSSGLWWKETTNCCFEISRKIRVCMQQCRHGCITISATSAKHHSCLRVASLLVIHPHFTGELGLCCSPRHQPVRQPVDGSLVGLWADDTEHGGFSPVGPMLNLFWRLSWNLFCLPQNYYFKSVRTRLPQKVESFFKKGAAQLCYLFSRDQLPVRLTDTKCVCVCLFVLVI